MIQNQRQINGAGSMRAVCLLSVEAFKKAVLEVTSGSDSSMVAFPSLIVLDFSMALADDSEVISLIKEQDSLAGIPLFFSVDERSEEVDEDCYNHGAMVVLHKVFSKAEVTRIEHTAWQHENTREYESKLQKAASELRVAKEIMKLNQQLEARNKLLHRIFERYFSDDVVDMILEKGEDVSLGGEKRNVTIMMSDLRNFTSISEKMDSAKVTSLLNFYFTKMVDIISSYNGTVIEFLGDGLLAVFGAPLKSPLQTDNAIAAAITMQNTMREVNEFCLANGFPHLEMGIGLHFGEVFVGNIGSERMMRYNVIGSTVNETSRIESCSVGGQVLVSSEIMGAAKNPIESVSDAVVSAKGLEKSLHIYEITSLGGDFNCSLSEEAGGNENYYPVEEEFWIHLHPLSGKMVSEDYVEARLIRVSEKRAIVEAEDLEDKLKVYTNVQISPADDTGFKTNFYSKITSRKDNIFTLHFTDAGKVSSRFVERWIRS